MNFKNLRLGTSLIALALLAQPVLAGGPASQSPGVSWAQDQSDIKPDPAVRFGVLPNGLRFAILHNKTPSDGAAMRLWIGSGAMMERDEEQGLAHFLEHMSFRGSTNIADGEVVRMLERHGLQFGADTNAFTSQDQIVYQLNFPKADAASLATGFTILRDVASRLSIKPELVEAERGVLISEERIRDTPQDRMAKTMYRQALDGTRAPLRFPIGTIEVLKSAGAERLRRLYQANFRPENAAVVIVGNIDPAVMEQEIRSRFADWKTVGAADVLVAGVPAPKQPVVEFVAEGAPDILALNWVAPVDISADTLAFEQARLVKLIGLTVLKGDANGIPGTERHIDMRIEKIEAGAAAPDVVYEDQLVPDRYVQFLCKRRGQQHQGQAVSRPGRERLRCVPGHRRIVFELELVLAVKRVEEPPLTALFAQLGSDIRIYVTLHRLA